MNVGIALVTNGYHATRYQFSKDNQSGTGGSSCDDRLTTKTTDSQPRRSQCGVGFTGGDNDTNRDHNSRATAAMK